MSTIPKLVKIENCELIWKEAGDSIKNQIFRQACLFCDKLKFTLAKTEIFCSPLPNVPDDFQIVCLREYSDYNQELYGLYNADTFYPVDENNNSLELFCFLNNLPADHYLQKLGESLEGYWRCYILYRKIPCVTSNFRLGYY